MSMSIGSKHSVNDETIIGMMTTILNRMKTMILNQMKIVDPDFEQDDKNENDNDFEQNENNSKR